MSSQIQPAKVDENKLNQFIGQMLGDLGGASSVAMVRLGAARWGFMKPFMPTGL